MNRAVLVAIILAAVAAAPATTSVTVAPSSMTFKDLHAACPGALAAISFTLNHARIAEQAGVTSDIDEAPTGGMSTIQLTGAGGASAVVNVNSVAHTVTAKNVKLSGKSAACVSPD